MLSHYFDGKLNSCRTSNVCTGIYVR